MPPAEEQFPGSTARRRYRCSRRFLQAAAWHMPRSSSPSSNLPGAEQVPAVGGAGPGRSPQAPLTQFWPGPQQTPPSQKPEWWGSRSTRRDRSPAARALAGAVHAARPAGAGVAAGAQLVLVPRRRAGAAGRIAWPLGPGNLPWYRPAASAVVFGAQGRAGTAAAAGALITAGTLSESLAGPDILRVSPALLAALLQLARCGLERAGREHFGGLKGAAPAPPRPQRAQLQQRLQAVRGKHAEMSVRQRLGQGRLL